MKTLRILAGVMVLVPAILAGSVVPAVGQSGAVDPRWTPWVGCWQLVAESNPFGAPDPSTRVAGTPERRGRSAEGVLVCVSPADQPGAVVEATVVDGQRIAEETLVADGIDRGVDEPGCQGARRVEWSQSGQLLLGTAQLTCAGQPVRRLSSLAMLLPGPTWLDVQMVDLGGRKSLRVRRYRHARDHTLAGGLLPTPGGPGRAPAPGLTIEHVKEASGKVAPEVIEAALIEVKPRFALGREQLVGLADAGVHESVIDLMVALTYPERFVVDHASWSGSSESWDWSDTYGLISLYAPFSYGYWGHYGPGWGWMPIDPDPPAAPEVHGRVVDGRGYTRVRPREAEPATSASGGGTSRTRSSGGSSSSGSSDSSGVSSSGYSSGSSGSTGRTAQPRPPNQ